MSKDGTAKETELLFKVLEQKRLTQNFYFLSFKNLSCIENEPCFISQLLEDKNSGFPGRTWNLYHHKHNSGSSVSSSLTALTQRTETLVFHQMQTPMYLIQLHQRVEQIALVWGRLITSGFPFSAVKKGTHRDKFKYLF